MRGHRERGRHAEHRPPVAVADEDPAAAAAHDAERIAANRQQPVEHAVADRELRAEHPVHPRRHRQGLVVGEERRPAAEQVPGRAILEELLGPQHDVLGVAPEERAAIAVAHLLVAPWAGERALELVPRELATREQRGPVEHGRRACLRRPAGIANGRNVAVQRRAHHADIGRPGGLRMVGLVHAHERGLLRRARPETEAPGLEGGQRDLVLELPIGQPTAGERPPACRSPATPSRTAGTRRSGSPWRRGCSHARPMGGRRPGRGSGGTGRRTRGPGPGRRCGRCTGSCTARSCGRATRGQDPRPGRARGRGSGPQTSGW